MHSWFPFLFSIWTQGEHAEHTAACVSLSLTDAGCRVLGCMEMLTELTRSSGKKKKQSGTRLIADANVPPVHGKMCPVKPPETTDVAPVTYHPGTLPHSVVCLLHFFQAGPERALGWQFLDPCEFLKATVAKPAF